MSKAWIISLVGVLTVLGFAAYLSMRSQPKPAAAFKVAINSATSQPRVATRPAQSSASAALSNTPVVQETRLPQSQPSLVPAAHSGRSASILRTGRQSSPQLRSAVAVAPSGETPTSGAPGTASGPAPAGLTIAEANNPRPAVATSNAPPPAPAPVVTNPASAVLLPHGSILLNGRAETSSTALFPGDRVEVPGGSYASINGNGSLLVLQPGSSAVYTGKALDLQHGGVAVSTMNGMPVNTEGLTIAPRSPHGKYDVLDDSGLVQIAALEGDVTVLDGGAATVLPQGQQATRDKRKPAAAESSSDQAPAPETPPATAAGGFPTGKVLLIGGAVAGGVVAAILLTRPSSKPVSPAVP